MPTTVSRWTAFSGRLSKVFFCRFRDAMSEKESRSRSSYKADEKHNEILLQTLARTTSGCAVCAELSSSIVHRMRSRTDSRSFLWRGTATSKSKRITGLVKCCHSAPVSLPCVALCSAGCRFVGYDLEYLDSVYFDVLVCEWFMVVRQWERADGNDNKLTNTQTISLT